MKMASVNMPVDESFEVVFASEEQSAGSEVARRRNGLLVSTLLLTTVAIAVAVFVWQNRAPKGSAVTSSQSVSRIALFDASQKLQPGQSVVVRQGRVAGVWRVVGKPNDAVAFKQAGSTKALFMVGDAGYILTSEKGTRTVPAANILAVVRPPSE
jgi:hypothetical protein